jgi:hypothetical protein
MGFRAPSNTALPYGRGTKLLHSCFHKSGQLTRSGDLDPVGFPAIILQPGELDGQGLVVQLGPGFVRGGSGLLTPTSP